MLNYRFLAVLISLGLFSAPVAAADFGLKLQCEMDNHSSSLLPKRIFVEVDETFLRARISDEVIREAGKESVTVDEVWVTNKKIWFSYKVIVNRSQFAQESVGKYYAPILYKFSLVRASGKFSLIFQLGGSTSAELIRGRGKCLVKA